MGRFLNADALASTGQGILGCNMYAYCGNLPTICEDESGQSWAVILAVAVIAATIHDIYQLCRKDEKAITPVKTEESVQIRNSTNIITPWVQLGYSGYLNYKSEHKDYFEGTSTAMAFEWTVHNLGYYGFGMGASAGDVFKVDTPNMDSWQLSCSNVDLGPTIYDDTGTGARGAMSFAMKKMYEIFYPTIALFDEIAYMKSHS